MERDRGAELSCPSDSVTLMVSHFSEEALTIPKGMILGVAQEVTENLVFATERSEFRKD
jgi:hypothetical protein